MSDATTKKRFWDYIREKYDAVKDKVEGNLSLVTSVSALALGGLTLLFYALSIGQLPEFTWNDLTGTLLAVCVTGVLVVGFSVVYCLLAGYFARGALESVYPEAAHDELAASGNPHVPVAPHTRLTRGPFVPGVTLFCILAWTGLFVGVSTRRLVPPYEEQLVGALVTAFVALVPLLLTDWHRFRRQRIRYALLSILGGALTTLCVCIAAWCVGPNNLVMTEPPGSTRHSTIVDWSKCSVVALDHAIAIGFFVALVVALLINSRTITSSVVRAIHRGTRKIPYEWPNGLTRIVARVARALTSMFNVVMGEPRDRRLVNAKVRVIVVFCFSTIGVFFFADAMARAGNAHDVVANFLYIVVLLIVLNWALFSVRHWKGRAGLGFLTAALVFVSYPMITRDPIMFPKMVVSLLGLGNERLASVALSSKQCATLAPYGVSCLSDNERAITLTNVNMLSRLGSSMVLELLIKDEGAAARSTFATSAPAGKTSLPLNSEPSPQSVKVLKATLQMGANSSSARFCDPLLLSQLEPTDAINATQLRCVELVVPKDQVLGYSTANRRDYRGEYTAYQPGPPKAPTIVRVLGDNVGVSGEKAALSVASTAR